jgi:hypothetical protein
MRMNIGRQILEQEDAERAAAAIARTAPQTLHKQLAAVDRQIAEIKSELDQHVDDDPSLWPLRKHLVALWNKRRGLVEQLGGGTQR